MRGLVDIGVNLTNRSLQNQLDEVLSRAKIAGVSHLVVTGTSEAESEKAIELCEAHPEHLFSTCGVHPHHASECHETSYQRLHQLAQHGCVRAIGETGLDFNRNYSPRDAQELAFEQQLQLATALNLPVFCHQRDAHDSFMAILRNHREHLDAVVVHCFTDNRAALEECLALDCHIGITGWICDERRGRELQQIVSLIPDNRLMVETDAPYLLPRDLDPKPASKTNEPYYLPHIVKSIAGHRQQSVEHVGRITTANSQAFFRLAK